jgi:hypothetical protein
MKIDAKILNNTLENWIQEHTPWLSWLYLRDERMIQHIQTDKCNTAYKENKHKNHLTSQ